MPTFYPIFLNFKVLLLLGFNFSIATILVESTLSAAESKYESCKPKNCGSGPNISYPFYVYGNKTDYCGHPGFRVHCSDHRPIYKTSAADYIIQNINYERQSFRLVDLQVFNNTTCPTPQQNYSFDRSSVDFIPYHADIFFFYNCDHSISTNYTESRVTCNSSVTTKIYIALVPRDEHFNWNRTACEFVVVAPVELGQWEINQTITNIDYKKKLSDGFTLKWIGLEYNCADCQSSGGLCGFEEENSVCYCPDGTHPKHCKNGNNRLAMKVGLGLGATVAVAVIILLSCVVLRQYIRRHGSSNLKSPISSSGLSSKSEIELGVAYFGIPIFSYAELEKATRNFDSEKELRDGGYGTVYYGKLQDGRKVAVKRLYEHNCKRVKQFLNEIKILTQLRHRNLVSLYG